MVDDGSLDDRYTVSTRHWHRLGDGRMQCDVCPRACRLREGQRGLCFVRGRVDDQVVLTSYGRSSGFCVDPIEKKPLNHFLPGSSVLSFGTAGCNLACRFCQNWGISKSREIDRLSDAAMPEVIAAAAERLGCRSVAMTYNDPVIFLEYALDVADACRARGIKAVAGCSFPATMTPTPRSRRIALEHGLRYVYTGNVHDANGSRTHCPGCGATVVERDWYVIGRYELTADACCGRCGTLMRRSRGLRPVRRGAGRRTRGMRCPDGARIRPGIALRACPIGASGRGTRWPVPSRPPSLDPDDPTPGIFEHGVDLDAVPGAVVVELGLGSVPIELATKLVQYPGLHHRPAGRIGRRQPSRGHAEQIRTQAAVGHQQLGWRQRGRWRWWPRQGCGGSGM